MELDVTKPFSRKQALAAGLSPRELAGPRFVRLHRGIYIANGYKPALNAECGILMRHRKGLTYVRGRTAARLWGGIVPDDSSLYFGTDDDWGQSRKLVRATRAAEQPALTTAYGIKITTPEQTFWDLGTEPGPGRTRGARRCDGPPQIDDARTAGGVLPRACAHRNQPGATCGGLCAQGSRFGDRIASAHAVDVGRPTR